MPGPRDYSTGTKAALAHLSQGTCYFSECREPMIRFVKGQPVANLHISHIAGANPGSPRFDERMTVVERAAFANLILLCKPHHDFVDRIAPHDYPAALLHQWKAEREGDGIDALCGLDGLTEQRLAEMLESVARQPQRTVVVDASGATLVDNGAATWPFGGWRVLLRSNPGFRDLRHVVLAHIRNTGELAASVEGVTLIVHVGAGSDEAETTLMGRNDFPTHNPDFPARLESGDAVKWMAALETVKLLVDSFEGDDTRAVAFHVEAHLATGETVKSERYAIDDLPLEIL